MPESLHPGAKIGKPGEAIPEMLLADLVLDYQKVLTVL